jgi:hypothetical protein
MTFELEPACNPQFRYILGRAGAADSTGFVWQTLIWQTFIRKLAIEK